jgi:hypothetical protein
MLYVIKLSNGKYVGRCDGIPVAEGTEGLMFTSKERAHGYAASGRLEGYEIVNAYPLRESDYTMWTYGGICQNGM